MLIFKGTAHRIPWAVSILINYNAKVMTKRQYLMVSQIIISSNYY